MVPKAPRTTSDKLRQAEGATSDKVPPPPPGFPRPTPLAEAADGVAGGSRARASGGDEATALDGLALATPLSRLITSASQRVAPTYTSSVVRPLFLSLPPSPPLPLPRPLLHDPACVSQHVLQGLTIQDYFICVYHKEEACVDTLFVFQDKT